MGAKELIVQEMEGMPDTVLQEVLDFMRFLKSKQHEDVLESTLLSESALRKDWLRPEEDEAWRDL